MEYLPNWIKPFDKIFTQLTYRWDHLQIFEDFLSIAVSNFQLVPTEGLAERMRSTYNEKELQLFAELFRCWVMTMHNEIKSEEWKYLDILGEYYQYLSGKYHKGKLGQFFTPQPMVDMLTEMTIEEPTDEIQTVSDPTAGSGRMLLSAHMKLKGKMLAFAEDIDGMCCKICALNFLIHGVEGEVIQHDSLRMSDIIQGWHVNPMRKYGAFYIQPITQEESVIMRHKAGEQPKAVQPQLFDKPPAEEHVVYF
ncbi:MAG: N-6 DNA methylase [Bacteroidetes bacterium]|nr:N-6 DNA methylase [Bacteroidota bacterium]